MRSLVLALLTLAVCLDTADRATSAPPGRADDAVPPDAPPAVAVVELFTSEGCSSCPPADAVLGRLAEESDGTVVPLAFHVDYWDRLGWRDPYASAAHTDRQRTYAAAGDGRVYTPQIVVGGEGGLVGSHEAAVRARIAQVLASSPTATVALEARRDGDSVAVDYGVDDAPDGARLHLALVQDATSQQVRRGENRGRRLTHVRVVRAFTTVPVGRGQATLRLPDGADGAWRIVGYVQPGRVGRVLGAAEVPLTL